MSVQCYRTTITEMEEMFKLRRETELVKKAEFEKEIAFIREKEQLREQMRIERVLKAQ